MNSFFIPQLGSQIYSMAGMRTHVHLEAAAAGRYAGLSANFSGDGFSRMTFTAIAMPAPRYREWLNAARRSPVALDWSGYQRLAAPSENVPVQYFSSVQPGLFDEVVNRYARGREKSTAAGMRPAGA
jgi:cytochrome o ubiquinol oxidase subunit 2